MSRAEYEWIAPHYDRLLGRVNAAFGGIALKILNLPGGARVLDVACGTGAAVEHYLRAGLDATGLERSPHMSAQAKKRLAGGQLVVGDATAMPFGDGEFDAATVMLALHEMDPPARGAVLAEIGRVLKPGAPLVAVDYHDQPPANFVARLRLAVSSLVERIAGERHYRSYIDFMGTGALPGLLAREGWTIERVKPLSGGRLAAVRATAPERPTR
ncbi:MAG: methyltransferase domain-containing protein [Deltaproteobacteria bacterium]|nr:methyltransferase domain-containing protein [Deltaproteobacteria bacterium]